MTEPNREAVEAAQPHSDAEFDANVERLKACEYIAEGDDGWEKLRNLCPSTAAVAKLRDILSPQPGRIDEERARELWGGVCELYPSAKATVPHMDALLAKDYAAVRAEATLAERAKVADAAGQDDNEPIDGRVAAQSIAAEIRERK